MIRITETDGSYEARCGLAVCALPIIMRADSVSGDELTEAISATGARILVRRAVDVSYVPEQSRSQDGRTTTDYVPRIAYYEGPLGLLSKLAIDGFGGSLTKIAREKDAASASRELGTVMRKVINGLCMEEWNWEGQASYETWANSKVITLMDGELPRVQGKFVAEMETERRLAAGRFLVQKGVISSLCCTSTGDPGKVFYGCEPSGYTVVEMANPLIREATEKRRGVINAVKNAVQITGEEPSPVKITGLARQPHMTSAVVVCMPISGDDSVIVSESLAKRLASVREKSKYHAIDDLINYHGGLRHQGRKGRLVKSECECPQSFEVIRHADGTKDLRRRKSVANTAVTSVTPNPDADLLSELRRRYETKYEGMVAKLGSHSAEEMARWQGWLVHQSAWTDRNKNRPAFRRFEGLKIEVVREEGCLMVRESLGLEYGRPEVGMKLQADGDLFKGVVSMILPDEQMPLIRLNGKLRRAEVVAEAGESMKKHGSLKLALGQIALYAVAAETGGIAVEPASMTMGDVARLGVESGVYEDKSLTCEVFSSEGSVSLGKFPAGTARVCRHKQDPSVCGKAKGIVADDVPNSESSMRAGGLVMGLPDTYCMLAAGLEECAKELRSKIPVGPAKRLELLRECVA